MRLILMLWRLARCAMTGRALTVREQFEQECG